MNVVFLSNYFNHHQSPLSEALAARCQYTFIATQSITAERLAMGWGRDSEPEYVCHSDREPERANQLIQNADAVIVGSAPQKMLRGCIAQNKLIFRYSERPLKNGNEWKKFIPRLLKWHWQNPPGKPIYMLCASGYTAGDYAKFGLFRCKTFQWGYFPETKCYESVDNLMQKKQPLSILWVGRLLKLKHPDDAICAAERLKKMGTEFSMNIIGRGEMEDTLRKMIDEKGLQECVHLLGSMTPEQVRHHMEQSRIFLFTSDRQEGWGAVLNEAMNSGCAVVASDAIGAVPFLIRDGENGCVYHSGDVEGLYRQIEALLAEPEWTSRLGRAAYFTISEQWNAEVAAERLINVMERLLSGEKVGGVDWEGPCSPAPIIREDWYRK